MTVLAFHVTGRCQDQCYGKPDGNYPSSDNPRPFYYRCYNGVLSYTTCHPNEVFNAWTRKCGKPSVVDFVVFWHILKCNYSSKRNDIGLRYLFKFGDISILQSFIRSSHFFCSFSYHYYVLLFIIIYLLSLLLSSLLSLCNYYYY